MLIKIITNDHQVLFFKTTDDIKIWKNVFSSYEIWNNHLNVQTTKISSTEKKKWNFHFSRNYSKCFHCLTESLSTQILILAIAPLLFISVSVLSEFTILPDVYILPSPQVHSSSWGDRCTHVAVHSSKRWNPLSFIRYEYLGNT